MDMSNMLKPKLARGELQLVGATTLDEYQQIEKDDTLARRFQNVSIAEPSIEDTVLIFQPVLWHEGQGRDSHCCGAF